MIDKHHLLWTAWFTRGLSWVKREWRVSEWISHIGLIPWVIPLKLFLDRVPSSFADFTHALCDVSQNDLTGNGRKSRAESFYKFCWWTASVPWKHPHNKWVTSTEGLSTMSKNSLRGITVEIRPLWGIHCLISFPLGLVIQTCFHADLRLLLFLVCLLPRNVLLSCTKCETQPQSQTYFIIYYLLLYRVFL